jgi:hypothetical protein
MGDVTNLLAALRETVDNLAMAARLSRDVPRMLRRPIQREPMERAVRHHLATRPQRLVEMARRTIYPFPNSPFRALLRHAGCELGDLESLVIREGVEAALSVLASRGVYVTFDESKGRRPIERGSLRLHVATADFDNRSVKPHLLSLTSGSGGRPSRVRHPMAAIDVAGVAWALVENAHGGEGNEMVLWWPGGTMNMLLAARVGRHASAWYYPVHPLPPLAVAAAWHTTALSALAGRPFPIPRHCPIDDPLPVLDWILRRRRAGRSITLLTMASAATRLALTATARGETLAGTLILAAGEPLTAARRAHIEAAGARAMPMYGTVEYLCIAGACPAGSSTDDLHAMTDRFALINRERPAMESGPLVDALLLTTLSPYNGKVGLNIEVGDYATLESRDCACSMGALGLRTHISAIRSFEKMTGEGVTFARSRLEEILETIVPARFGGTSADYQLAEEEAPDSMTRLVLRAHPRVGPLDEAALRALILGELGQEGIAASYQAAMWHRARTIEIRREAPRPNRGGKVLPFQLLARG